MFRRASTRIVTLAAFVLFVGLAAAQSSLPETAMGPQIDQEKGYLVEEIADGLYWVTEGTYNLMFLVTDEGVVVVDAPPSIGERIIAAVQEVTDQPITHVVYSHSHGDHIGAAGRIFPDDVTIIAQAATAVKLIEADDPLRPVPTVTFSTEYTLELGGKTLELAYPGANHEAGNIFVYAPEQRTLMFVDVVFPGWVPFKYLALAKDVPGFVAVHDAILEYDFDTFVGGHLTRLGTREDVEVARTYVHDVFDNSVAALQSVDFMAIGQEVGFQNQWALFEAYLDAVAQHCTDATLETWAGELGGAEVFTFSHCWTMMEAIRVDWNLVGGATPTLD